MHATRSTTAAQFGVVGVSDATPENDPRPEWMREEGITEADIRREAESDAPDAWVFERIGQSVFGWEGES